MAVLLKNAANTLLARLYLNSEVFIGQARWNGVFLLVIKYQDMFLAALTNFLTKNQVSKEIIFAVPYDHTARTTGYFASLLSTISKNKRSQLPVIILIV